MSNENKKEKGMTDNIPIYCSFDKIVDIDKVIPNPKNPNKHSTRQIELLAKIIKAQGWRAPITVSLRSGYVVRGHGRLEAAINLGLTQVPVDYQNYDSDAMEKADLLADNQIANYAELSRDETYHIIEDLSNESIDLDLSGFDGEALQEFLNDVGTDITGIDEAPDNGGGSKGKRKCPKCGYEW